MSPEQVSGVGGLDRRTDVWSLGATLFEALCGRRPFEAATRAELARAIQHTNAPSLTVALPTAPRDLVVVVETCLARHPQDRYATMATLAADLRRVQRGEPILARPISFVGRAWRWARREPAIATSLGVGLVAIVTGLVISVWYAAAAHRAQVESERSFARLADGATLRRALEEFDALLPIEPADAPALRRWLQDFGEPLAAALPGHRRELEALRQRGRPPDGDARAARIAAHAEQREIARLRAELRETRKRLQLPLVGERERLLRRIEQHLERQLDSARRRIEVSLQPEFDDPADRALFDGLTSLVAGLRTFAGAGGTLEHVRRHLAWTESVVEQDGLDWERVARELAADERFAGVELEPWAWFVPVGADPDSGLQEFALQRSGVVPSRDAAGRLLLDADSAVVFVLVPGGRYTLGRPRFANNVAERFSETVELAPFFIARSELSRGQWERLTDRSAPEDGLLQVLTEMGPDHPLEGLSWETVDTALREVGLELPTEAQWEYAAAAGTTTRFWWGDGVPPDGTIPDNLRDRCFEALLGAARSRGYDDGHAGVAPIQAPFTPNPFGLVGVYGNVAEWCRESFMPRTGLDSFTAEPPDAFHRVPRLGNFAVRGGSFETRIPTLHGGARRGLRGGIGHPAVGVRPVRRLR